MAAVDQTWRRNLQSDRNISARGAYGLTGQLRRSGVSIASNIAEGYVRGSRGEYKQFLTIARGSNHELQTQLVFARELKLGTEEHIRAAEALSDEIGKMLTAMLKKLWNTQTTAGRESGAGRETYTLHPIP
jgi:four helix bundle protein